MQLAAFIQMATTKANGKPYIQHTGPSLGIIIGGKSHRFSYLSFFKSPSFRNFPSPKRLLHPNEGPASYIPLTTLHLFLPLESTLLSLVIPCPSPPQGTVPENLQAHVAMRQAIYSMYVVLSTADRIEYKYARKQPQGQG